MTTPDLGPHLKKATEDSFDYALGLKSGAVLRFTGTNAEIEGEWMVIQGGRIDQTENMGGFKFERGLQIRISEIEWFADGPEGS